MKTKTPHPHAAFIAEAALDMSRDIFIEDDEFEWCHGVLQDVVDDEDGNSKFCFADTLKQKAKIVSSLKLQEMHNLFYGGKAGATTVGFSAVADAAAQRAIEDLEMPCAGWFNQQWLDTDYPYLAIQRYIRDLKEGKL